jgi:hypothetical protein
LIYCELFLVRNNKLETRLLSCHLARLNPRSVGAPIHSIIVEVDRSISTVLSMYHTVLPSTWMMTDDGDYDAQTVSTKRLSCGDESTVLLTSTSIMWDVGNIDRPWNV